MPSDSSAPVRLLRRRQVPKGALAGALALIVGALPVTTVDPARVHDLALLLAP